MRPLESTTVPVPMRSSPSMRVDGCADGTSVWMCTTTGSSRLTSSTEASMGQSLTLARRPVRGQRGPPSSRRTALEDAGQEGLHLPVRVISGGGIVGHGDAVGAEVEGLLDLLQHRLLLSDHVEVVIRPGILHEGHVRPARLLVGGHLAAIARRRPIVRPRDEQEKRTDHQLLGVVVAPSRIHGDGRRIADGRQHDAARPGTLERRPVDHGHGEDAALRPSERGNPLRDDEGLGLEVLEGADGVVESRGGGHARLLVVVRLAVGRLLPGPKAVHHEGDVAAVGEPARPVVHLRRDTLTAVQEDERGKGTGAVGFAQARLDAIRVLGGGALEADGTRAADGDDHHDGERAQTRGWDHARKYIAALLRYNRSDGARWAEYPAETIDETRWRS